MKSVLLNTTVIGSSVKLPRHPRLIIGEPGKYLHGDILDANAVIEKIDIQSEGILAQVQQLDQKIDRQIEVLIGGAPDILDTLKEISDALGNDDNLAATLTNQIAALNTKVDNNSINQTTALNAVEEALSNRITVLEGASSWIEVQ